MPKFFQLWNRLGLGKALRDERLSDWRAAVVLATLFWISTYALFSVRSLLIPPAGPDLVSGKRLVLTLFGAMLFFWAVMWTRRLVRKSRGRRWLLAVGCTGAASIALLLIRIVYNDWAEPYAFDLADHGRWIFVWSGYFLAGVALSSPEQPTAEKEEAATATVEQAVEEEQAIWVQRNKRSTRIGVAQIEWLEAQGNYVYAHAGEAGGLLRGSLTAIEQKLASHGFVRVHRSALCQRDHIRSVERTQGGAIMVILTSGAELPVGRRYAGNVTALFEN